MKIRWTLTVNNNNKNESETDGNLIDENTEMS